MIGCGLSHEAVARFAASLRDIDGVTRVGVASSDRGRLDDASGGDADSGSATNCRVTDFISQFTIIITFDEVVIEDSGLPTAPPPTDSGAKPGDSEE